MREASAHPVPPMTVTGPNIDPCFGRFNGIRAGSVLSKLRPLFRSFHNRPLTAAIFSPAKSILLVSDPDKRPAPAPRDLLRKLFNLTLTEVVWLSHLDQEVALPAAAEIMGISFETARSHLKHIFSKTGTNRQSDLLMLIQRVHRQHIV